MNGALYHLQNWLAHFGSLVALTCVLFAPAAYAQNSQGTILGHIVEPSIRLKPPENRRVTMTQRQFNGVLPVFFK